MQTLFLAFLMAVTFCSHSFADNEIDTELDKKYSIELENQPQIEKLNAELTAFAEKKKLESRDKSALVETLKKVLVLEDMDPSRDGTLDLSDSYIENKKMYQSAAKKFTKDEQKKLNEIFKILENAHKSTGND